MNVKISKIKSILPSLSMRKAGWTVFSSLLFSISLSSCLQNAGVEYSRFVATGETGIPENWEYEFSPVPADSASIGKIPFDLILVVRYSATTESKDVMFDIEEFSLQQDIPDTTSVKVSLFNEENKPLGKGNFAIYEIADTLRRGIKIPEGYTISVSSPLTQEETVGINAIGIILSRTGSSRNFNFFNL